MKKSKQLWSTDKQVFVKITPPASCKNYHSSNYTNKHNVKNTNKTSKQTNKSAALNNSSGKQTQTS